MTSIVYFTVLPFRLYVFFIYFFFVFFFFLFMPFKRDVIYRRTRWKVKHAVCSLRIVKSADFGGCSLDAQSKFIYSHSFTFFHIIDNKQNIKVMKYKKKSVQMSPGLWSTWGVSIRLPIVIRFVQIHCDSLLVFMKHYFYFHFFIFSFLVYKCMMILKTTIDQPTHWLIEER